jgi:lysophospholipase L1-like esterase
MQADHHLDKEHWVCTWAASPAAPLADSAALPAYLCKRPVIDNQTLRQIVHTTIGGDQVRVGLSNTFGSQPLVIGAAHIAIRKSGSIIVPRSDRILTFGGRPSVSIPPYGSIFSDPANLELPALVDLAVSIHFPMTSPDSAVHWTALQTSYLSYPGNYTGDVDMSIAMTTKSWYWLTTVDVKAPETSGAIVVLGDSITDGDGDRSTQDTNTRWTNVLAARLIAHRSHTAVVNAAIDGNRILHNGAGLNGPMLGPGALKRFDSDVLDLAGVKYVVVLEGINDIGHPGCCAPASETVSADDITAGLRQLSDRAHEKKLPIFVGTLTPFEGACLPGFYTTEKEAQRQSVNRWILANAAFDGVIDFDRAVRNPNHVTQLLPAYDCGDHLHLNDTGWRAMGDVIDLSLFR